LTLISLTTHLYIDMASTEIVSPLAQLLEGIHSKRRERVDDAMRQIRTLLKPTLAPSNVSTGLVEVVRLVLSHSPELACAVNPDDGSLPLHHAVSLGDVAVAELLLSTVRHECT
jgi:ankyrin repeat protein